MRMTLFAKHLKSKVICRRASSQRHMLIGWRAQSPSLSHPAKLFGIQAAVNLFALLIINFSGCLLLVLLLP